MEFALVLMTVFVIVFAFTDIGHVLTNAIKAPFYLIGHAVLWLIAIMAMPLIILKMAKAIKEQENRDRVTYVD